MEEALRDEMFPTGYPPSGNVSWAGREKRMPIVECMLDTTAKKKRSRLQSHDTGLPLSLKVHLHSPKYEQRYDQKIHIENPAYSNQL
jgi:hypothetical protein